MASPSKSNVMQRANSLNSSSSDCDSMLNASTEKAAATDILNLPEETNCDEEEDDDVVVIEGEETDDISDQSHPVFKALSGYGLYTKVDKQKSVLTFLKLSSHSIIFSSGDEELTKELSDVIDSPLQSLKKLKNGSSIPSKWGLLFCTEFITKVVLLIEKDEEIRNKTAPKRNTGRKSSLPSAAAELVTMVERARLKVQNDSRLSKQRNTRKNIPKTTKELLIKSNDYRSNLTSLVHSNQVDKEILCPMCNHRSIIALSTKASVNKVNNRKKEIYKQKLAEWEAEGKPGSKPRMLKMASQKLGCVCSFQNCIGNTDGTGCFKCKQMNGDVATLKTIER